MLLVSFVDLETAVLSSLIASCEGISADSEFLPAIFCSNSKVFGARQTLSSQVCYVISAITLEGRAGFFNLNFCLKETELE